MPNYDIEVEGDGNIVIREISRESGINMPVINTHTDTCMTIDGINTGESQSEIIYVAEIHTGNVTDDLQFGESNAQHNRPLTRRQKRHLSL